VVRTIRNNAIHAWAGEYDMSAFDEYWITLIQKNPGLENESDRMTISVAAFKKALSRSFEAGLRESESRKKAADDFADIGRKDYGKAFGDLFGGMFK
jgi:hypothetical protein